MNHVTSPVLNLSQDASASCGAEPGALWGRMVVALLAVFQAILVAFFCVSPEEDIYPVLLRF